MEVSSQSVTIAGRQALLSVIRDISRRGQDEADRERLFLSPKPHSSVQQAPDPVR